MNGIIYRISQVGLTQIVPAFEKLYTFITTPLNQYLSFRTVLNKALSDLGKGDYISAIYESFSYGRLSKLFGGIGNLMNTCLSILGFDTSLPLWEFLLVNIVPLCTMVIVMRFKSAVFS